MTRSLLVMPLLLVALSAPIHAQQLFTAPYLTFDAGSLPVSVAIADLNADGRPDLAVANAASNTVSVLLGNGDGTFATNADFGTGAHPSCVAIADLNADGRPDLAVANWDSSTVSVLLGNGDGTFGTRMDFITGIHPASVAIADLNADGRPDLVVAEAGAFVRDRLGGHYAGIATSVLLGNGDGTFGTRTDLIAAYGPISAAIADLNADGRPDLVVAGNSGDVSVRLGNGDGTFSSTTAISLLRGLS
jgi:hypothetical protein